MRSGISAATGMWNLRVLRVHPPREGVLYDYKTYGFNSIHDWTSTSAGSFIRTDSGHTVDYWVHY